MSWNTDNIDPIGDLTRMKEAIESNNPYNIYVNPFDLGLVERSGIFDQDFFVIPDDHVPSGYIIAGNKLIYIESLMAMREPKLNDACILYDLGQKRVPGDLTQQQPRNRAERRAAMKKRKRDNVYEYKKNR